MKTSSLDQYYFAGLSPFEIMQEVKSMCTIYPLFIVFKETDNRTCLLEPDQGKILHTTVSLLPVCLGTPNSASIGVTGVT